MTVAQAVLALLLILSQLLAWRYFHARLRRKFPKALLNLVYILFNILGLYALLTVYILNFPPPSFFLWDFIVRPGLIWELVHLFWLIPAALTAFAGLSWNALFRREPKGLPKLFRREKPGPRLSDPVGLILAVMLLFAFYGYTRQLAPPGIAEIAITFPDLPQELDGFTLAVASDFHYGRGQNRQELQRAFEAMAARGPHAVFLLGDMVNGFSLLAENYQEPLGRLHNVPYGVWAVLGNHDHYTDSPYNVTQLLSNAGATVLSDRRANLHGAPLTVIGFNDPGTRDFDLYPLSIPDDDRPLPFHALQGPAAPQDNFTILLTHRPAGIQDASGRGVDLYLAGHTRGGDFRLPWSRDFNPASVFYSRSSGRYSAGDMEIYVTDGLSAPVSPFRLFAWPEIAVITLRRGPRAPRDAGGLDPAASPAGGPAPQGAIAPGGSAEGAQGPAPADGGAAGPSEAAAEGGAAASGAASPQEGSATGPSGGSPEQGAAAPPAR
ncbi:MAG: metallophosphoesterase [Deltaproteobacteria bacterium]|jgi:predicted MPP superfamily phosphohydrolase|nr:metallophosphoesterase [Deltaproteobacteria bacterium]